MSTFSRYSNGLTDKDICVITDNFDTATSKAGQLYHLMRNDNICLFVNGLQVGSQDIQSITYRCRYWCFPSNYKTVGKFDSSTVDTSSSQVISMSSVLYFVTVRITC